MESIIIPNLKIHWRKSHDLTHSNDKINLLNTDIINGPHKRSIELWKSIKLKPKNSTILKSFISPHNHYLFFFGSTKNSFHFTYVQLLNCIKKKFSCYSLVRKKKVSFLCFCGLYVMRSTKFYFWNMHFFPLLHAW